MVDERAARNRCPRSLRTTLGGKQGRYRLVRERASETLLASMEDMSFQSLVAKAKDYYLPRNQRLFSILHRDSKSIRVDAQADGEELVILIDGAERIRSKFQVVGHRLLANDVWRWAWSIPEVDANLARDATAARRFGEMHGIQELTTPELPITAQLQADLAGVAMMLASGDAMWLLVRQRGLFESVVLHGLTVVPGASA